MRQNVLRIGPYAAADADLVAVSQTPAAGGEQALTLTSAVVTMDTPRQVVFTFAADESARRFLVSGTRVDGKQVVEAVAGTASTATTVNAFATVTEILIDGDSAGAIEAGTATIVSTSWLPLDYIIPDFKVGLVLSANGATMDMTVELTLTNLLSPRGNDPKPTRNSWFGSKFDVIYPDVNPIDHDTMVNITVDSSGNIAFPTNALRLTSNAVISGGTPELEVLQSGHRGG
jgi:hypothetical protein